MRNRHEVALSPAAGPNLSYRLPADVRGGVTMLLAGSLWTIVTPAPVASKCRPTSPPIRGREANDGRDYDVTAMLPLLKYSGSSFRAPTVSGKRPAIPHERLARTPKPHWAGDARCVRRCSSVPLRFLAMPRGRQRG
jgi:hypothetical protein